jgi:hypothetical protein
MTNRRRGSGPGCIGRREGKRDLPDATLGAAPVFWLMTAAGAVARTLKGIRPPAAALSECPFGVVVIGTQVRGL